MGGRWPYSCCFVGCCFQDLSDIARSILVRLLSSFFSIRLVSVLVIHPYRKNWKKLRLILSDKSDFHMTESPLIAIHALRIDVIFRRCDAASNVGGGAISVDETLLPRQKGLLLLISLKNVQPRAVLPLSNSLGKIHLIYFMALMYIYI